MDNYKTHLEKLESLPNRDDKKELMDFLYLTAALTPHFENCWKQIWMTYASRPNGICSWDEKKFIEDTLIKSPIKRSPQWYYELNNFSRSRMNDDSYFQDNVKLKASPIEIIANTLPLSEGFINKYDSDISPQGNYPIILYTLLHHTKPDSSQKKIVGKAIYQAVKKFNRSRKIQEKNDLLEFDYNPIDLIEIAQTNGRDSLRKRILILMIESMFNGTDPHPTYLDNPEFIIINSESRLVKQDTQGIHRYIAEKSMNFHKALLPYLHNKGNLMYIADLLLAENPYLSALLKERIIKSIDYYESQDYGASLYYSLTSLENALNEFSPELLKVEMKEGYIFSVKTPTLNDLLLEVKRSFGGSQSKNPVYETKMKDFTNALFKPDQLNLRNRVFHGDYGAENAENALLVLSYCLVLFSGIKHDLGIE